MLSYFYEDANRKGEREERREAEERSVSLLTQFLRSLIVKVLSELKFLGYKEESIESWRSRVAGGSTNTSPPFAHCELCAAFRTLYSVHLPLIKCYFNISKLKSNT